jgi:hypothetical protein
MQHHPVAQAQFLVLLLEALGPLLEPSLRSLAQEIKEML